MAIETNSSATSPAGSPTVDAPWVASPPEARPVGGHPLGPLVERGRAKNPLSARLIAAGCALGGVVLLGVALWLTPDPRGFGTHTQLGQPECGFLLVTKLPCPTCGMTTAFAHAVRGQWLRAIVAQPMGFLLALATAGTVVVSLMVIVTGTVWNLNWYRVSASRFVFAVFALFLAGWAVRIGLHLRAAGSLGG